MNKYIFRFSLGLAFTPRLFAHPGHGGGFAAGISHPIFGLDHLLAMLCVGLFAAKLDGKARSGLLLAFPAAMLAGAASGIHGVALPRVEFFIVLSVIVLGFSLIPEKIRIPGVIGAVIAFFGFFHGHAHGTEMPDMAHAGAYAAGFLITTASLLVSGMILGLLAAPSKRSSRLLRIAGAGIAGTGLQMWIG